MVAPEGQGEQLPANTTFTPQETPGRPRDLEFNMRLAGIGVKPDDFGHFLQNPEDIKSKQLSNQKTEQNIQHEQAKERECYHEAQLRIQAIASKPATHCSIYTNNSAIEYIHAVKGRAKKQNEAGCAETEND